MASGDRSTPHGSAAHGSAAHGSASHGSDAVRPAPTPRDVWIARARLRGRTHATRLRRAPELDPDAGTDGDADGGADGGGRVWIADETVQPTGSFKLRGATNAVLARLDEARTRGVVAVSTGNHGRAVAHVARSVGARATVFVSEHVPAGKLDALSETGATLRVGGTSQDEAEDAARAYAEQSGALLIPPFDHPDVIAGQGTLGLEIVDVLPDVATVVVPLSGGGLVAGVALAIRSVAPDIRIVGVSMQDGAAMIESLAAGRIVALPEAPTLADSLQGGLGRDNRYTLRAVRELVDATVRVDETAIAGAMRHAFVRHRLVLEGGGAVAIAAVLAGAVEARGPTVLIASGANVEPSTFARVLDAPDADARDADTASAARDERER